MATTTAPIARRRSPADIEADVDRFSKLFHGAVNAETRDAAVLSLGLLDELYLRDPRKTHMVTLETVLMLCEMNERNRERNNRIAALEARINALEARPIAKWQGTYSGGKEYPECSLVTHHGSMWTATRTTTTIPGAPGSEWRLVVKKGGA